MDRDGEDHDRPSGLLWWMIGCALVVICTVGWWVAGDLLGA